MSDYKERIDAVTQQLVEMQKKVKQKTQGDNAEYYKGLLDGTLEEFSAPDVGVTSLAPYRFYSFQNLTKADFTGITDIPAYTCNNCATLNSITFDSAPTKIGSYAFYSTKITDLKGILADVGSSAFRSNSNLATIDIEVNGEISSDAFSETSHVSSFHFNKNSKVTRLGDSTFKSLGSLRQTADANVFIFDFKNSTFSNIGNYCFQGYGSSQKNKYFDIYFPTTLSTINPYAFQYTDNFNIYYNSVPTLSSTNVFSSATNFKNFFPYDLAQTAKTATNWSSSTNGIVDSIFGYAPENSFSQGEELPIADNNGYALTWYSDISMTTQVTIVTDPSQIYYCQVGAREFAKLAKVSQFQATCTVSGDTKTYVEGDLIRIGTLLTITAVGEGANTQVYQFTLNGANITSGDEYTVTADDISIVCIYWDGVNVPVNPNFADNTPAQIKVGLDTGVGRDLWTVGDTIPITLTDGTQYNLILYDMTANRYQKTDGTGYSNGVLGFVEITQRAQMNTTDTNIGGWAESHIKTVTMEEIYNKLPTEWQAVISEVNVASTIGNLSTAISYSANKLFLPARVEFFPNVTDAGLKDEGTLFDYFVGTSTGSDTKRVKNYQGSASLYWLRSPSTYVTSIFYYVSSSGDWGSNGASYTNGVAACFAI